MKTLIALLIFASFAHGANYYLQPDGSVAKTAIVATPPPTSAEARIAELERKVRYLEGQMYALSDPKNRPHPQALTPTPTGERGIPHVVVPPGQHAHRRSDGTVFTHGNENVGNAAAHEGVPHPWPRIAEAGQTVSTGSTTQTATMQTYSIQQSSSCPNGVCPTQRSGWYLGKNLGR